MDPSFWFDRWQRNEIGFHQPHPHRALERHWGELGLERDARVFLPLAGKSLDLLWLRRRGHEVVGIEIAELAVRAFFGEHSLGFRIEPAGTMQRFRGEGIELLCGDFFALERTVLGPVAGVFDRAALVALPPALRARYAAKMAGLTVGGCRTLLVTLEYGGTMSGPPFNVDEAEVRSLYGSTHRIRQLERAAPEDAEKFAERGALDVFEAVYLLERL